MNTLRFWKELERAQTCALQGDFPSAQGHLDTIHENHSTDRINLNSQHLSLLQKFALHYELRYTTADPAGPSAPQTQGLIAKVEDGPELRACNAAMARDPSDVGSLLSLALRCRSSNPRRARQVLTRVASSEYPEARIARAALVSWLEEKST